MPVLSPGRSTKLHSDSTFDYFKVKVEAGVRMVEGATTTVCEKIGMSAVCQGPSGCNYNDESKCRVTPVSDTCGSNMGGISKVTSLLPLPIPSHLHRPSAMENHMPQGVPSWREFLTT